MTTIRIATRRSPLAQAQSRLVLGRLAVAHPDVQFELVTMQTRGDRTGGSLVDVGGKGLFTEELEQAIRAGRVDLAVHSAKDLPASLPGDMSIVACPAREDPRDALLSRDGLSPADLPAGAVVGTSSLRRALQIRRLRPDVRTAPVRGNVETRLGKMLAGEFDAILLAMAGLNRGGWAAEHAAMIHALPLEGFLPAAGQGILALEALTEARSLAERLAAVNDADAHAALLAERAVVRALAATCTAPLAVYVWPTAQGWAGRSLVGGSGKEPTIIEAEAAGAASARQVGQSLAEQLLRQGARELLGEGPDGRDGAAGD